MRYLITGTNGFIGRSLVAKLGYDLNNQIFAVDLSLDALSDQPNVEKIPLDLLHSDGKDFPEVDCVIHAAALLGVDFVENNPLITVLDNISMFRSLKKYVEDKNLRFVFFSTSEVYGDGRSEDGAGKAEDIENDPSVQLKLPDLRDPRSSYPISKIVGEFISNQFKKPICFRPHNIYGPQMGDRHVMPQLISKINNAKDGDSVPVFNPSHIRSFCFIEDAVDQMIYWINSEKVGPINIGNSSEPITIENLFNMITRKMNKNIHIHQEDKHLTSPQFRRPKIHLDDFSFTPLSKGLDSMIEYYS